MPSFMNPETYPLSHERIVQANDEGCDAYEAGRPLSANPYGINNLRLQYEWEGAWLDTRAAKHDGIRGPGAA
jgi:hypothetical protein